MQTISLAMVRARGQGLRWVRIPRLTQGSFDRVADDIASMTASERGDALDEPTAQTDHVLVELAQPSRRITHRPAENGRRTQRNPSVGSRLHRRGIYGTRVGCSPQNRSQSAWNSRRSCEMRPGERP